MARKLKTIIIGTDEALDLPVTASVISADLVVSANLEDDGYWYVLISVIE